jgi:hypothetical protein
LLLFRFNTGIFLLHASLSLSLSALEAYSQNPAPVQAASATPPDAVVITIGELKLTAREVDRILENLPPQNRRFFSSREGCPQFAEFIVRNKLLAAEAEKRNLQEREDVKLSLNIFRESYLANQMQKELMKEIRISDSEATKFLNDNLASFDEAKVSRIVIRSASTNQFYSDGKRSEPTSHGRASQS